jgi:eukaryotic-like serine/threonine-protein kinase
MSEASPPSMPTRGLERLDPVTMAEVVLLALNRGQLTTVGVTPGGSGYEVLGERAGHGVLLGDLPAALGDALTARLTLLAGLDPAASEEQVGRIRTRRSNCATSVEHLVAMRGTGSARFVEVRSIVGTTAQAAAPDHANRSLGTYTLLEEIGRGAMGVVHRGEHLMLQKPVAIKVLHHGIAHGAEAATRLIMEARAACRARHSAIVDISDVGRLSDGRTFLVMELVEAPTLDIVLAKGPLTVDRALHVAGQVTQALMAASDAGVVHRDIKPGNLFLLEDDRVKVADFGVARIRVESDASNAPEKVAGTAWYMAPEQALGKPPDPRSDLYALGVVMFEMLTGRVPFDGERALDVLTAHIHHPVSSMVGPEGLIPPPVEVVVRRALEKNPDDRFESPAQMLRALEDAAAALEGRSR